MGDFGSHLDTSSRSKIFVADLNLRDRGLNYATGNIPNLKMARRIDGNSPSLFIGRVNMIDVARRF